MPTDAMASAKYRLADAKPSMPTLAVRKKPIPPDVADNRKHGLKGVQLEAAFPGPEPLPPEPLQEALREVGCA
jgi:hypothetical protein